MISNDGDFSKVHVIRAKIDSQITELHGRDSTILQDSLDSMDSGIFKAKNSEPFCQVLLHNLTPTSTFSNYQNAGDQVSTQSGQIDHVVAFPVQIHHRYSKLPSPIITDIHHDSNVDPTDQKSTFSDNSLSKGEIFNILRTAFPDADAYKNPSGNPF